MAVQSSDRTHVDGGRTYRLPRLLGFALAGGLVAALLSLLILVIGQAVSGPFLIPAQPGAAELAPLPIPALFGATLVPALAAGLLLWGLSRVVARPLTLFTGLAVLFLLLSFIPVLSLPVDGGTRLGLGLMHLVAAGSIVGALRAAVARG